MSDRSDGATPTADDGGGSSGRPRTDGGPVADDTDGTRGAWFERHAAEPLFRVPDLGSRGDVILQSVLVLVAAVLVQTLFAAVGVWLLDPVGITETGSPVAFFPIQSALGLSGFLIVGLAYLRWRDDPGLVGIRRPTRRDALLILAGSLLLAGTQLAAGSLFEWLGFEVAENVIVEQGRENAMLFLVLIPLQFLFTGPAEELLFRGIVQGLFRQAYGIVPAVGLASALFALFHLPVLVDGHVMAGLTIVFLSGLVLGGLYEYSRTLVVPVLVHALWNTLVFATGYADATEVLLAW